VPSVTRIVAEPDWLVDSSPSRVDAWSSRRLPFEPSGWLLDYRAHLGIALRHLQPVRGSGLSATYAAPDEGFVDVENACLYNVDTGSYRHLLAGGLTCRREPSPATRHHLSYRVEAPPAPMPSGCRPLAQIRADVPAQPPHTAGQWWALLRSGVRPEVTGHDGSFIIDITVPTSWRATTIGTQTKSLLDGVVSALHRHDGSHEEQLRQRLAHLGDSESVWEILNSPEKAVLGRARTLVRPFRQGVAWNPADDLCQSFRIRPSTDPGHSMIVNVLAPPVELSHPQ
jgi:hypothetical protein